MTKADVTTIEDLTPMLVGDQMPEFVDPEQASRDIVRRILEAEDLDALFEQAGTIGCDDVLGKPLSFRDFRPMRSAFEEGAGMYFVVDAADLETGEQLVISCGARNVMAQLYRAKQLGALPLNAAIVKAPRPTANGYYPLWLERVA